MSIFINNNRSVNPVIAILVTVIFFVALFYLAKGIFSLLMWLTPVLLIAAAVLNYRVYIDFAKKIGRRLRQNTIIGILYIVLCFFAFPLVAAYLFGKAFLSYKIKKIEKDIEIQREGEYADYEILDEDPLSLPSLKSEKKS